MTYVVIVDIQSLTSLDVELSEYSTVSYWPKSAVMWRRSMSSATTATTASADSKAPRFVPPPPGNGRRVTRSQGPSLDLSLSLRYHPLSRADTVVVAGRLPVDEPPIPIGYNVVQTQSTRLHAFRYGYFYRIQGTSTTRRACRYCQLRTPPSWNNAERDNVIMRDPKLLLI
jgi:hypothetical protein